jgi:glycosyltransferase involved in cell wall biosynthesis
MSKGVQDGNGGTAWSAVCLLVPMDAPVHAANADAAPSVDPCAAAVAVNHRIAPMLASCLDRDGALPGDWRAASGAAPALDAVRAFVAAEVAPRAVSVLCDARLRWLSPVWVAALDEAGVQVFLVESGGAQDERAGAMDEDIAYRDRLLREYDAQLASLRETVHDQRGKLLTILESRSWKLTQPLRRLGSLLRHEPAADIAADEDAFDAQWYLAQYPDVAASHIDPYAHYVANGRKEGRLPRAPTPPPAAADPAPRKGWWQRLAAGKTDGAHGAQAGAHAGGAPGADDEAFDAEFYLLQYPDIASAGVDPYEHYTSHGKAEGRQAVRPRLQITDGAIPFDPSRETVLVVAHEASRTGAPVLSLNLVTSLDKRYNVIAMLLGDGPLAEDFRSGCTWLAGPMDLRGAPVRAAVIIDQLVALHRPKFAVVNSIESRVVLEPLARHGIATVSLVHEFAAYTRPRTEFRSALHWADETVFSTPLTRESAYLEFPDLVDKAFAVLPQGRCELHVAARDEDLRRREDSRLLAALRPRGKADDAFVILGAGFVQQRKGVDLFIQCASQVMASERGRHCRFVWIGSGYDPERDMAYSVYLADQLRRSGLDKVVRIIDETSSIETAYQAADVLLLSSRLDPLPNVAIDAMAHGLPVVCFDKTSGIANVLVEEGLRDVLVAGYLDTHDMAAKVLDLASSPDLRQRVRQRVLEVVDSRFNMETYVRSLERLALDADARLARRAAEVGDIERSGLFQPDFHGSRAPAGAPLASVVEHDYLRAWASGIGRRKPFPGFHPGVYREQCGARDGGDPLADFIRAGQPDGPWRLEVITAAEAPPPVDAGGRVALHVHVYYPDMLPDILARLAANVIRPDLFISVPNSAAKAMVEPMLAAYEGKVAQLQVVPNRGRDIGPFLTAFGGHWPAYDVVGHVHTKKSLDLNDSAFAFRWNGFLMDNLLGRGLRMADAIVGRLLADPGLGLVFPDDPHVVGWSGNLAFGRQLGDRLGLADFPSEFNFPVGTMFWARSAALAPLPALGLQWDDYPAEPLGYDGTMLHAIERLIPSVVASRGFRCAVTHVPGVTR